MANKVSHRIDKLAKAVDNCKWQKRMPQQLSLLPNDKQAKAATTTTTTVKRRQRNVAKMLRAIWNLI